ncbi:hypothetical protein C8J57DRAFT_1318033 [Mycena rebaudengoi]|nr:hypothetical protein C8J57DRAFT_1318033 [Mycena rebaudengoi]
MDYLDVPPQVLELFSSRLIPFWYNSDQWRDYLQEEKAFNDAMLKNEETWPMFQQIFGLNLKSGFDQKKHYKTTRITDQLKKKHIKQVERDDLDRIIACGNCGVLGSTLPQPLRVFGGCRNEKYCSTECQKFAWKEHKAPCKASQKRGT